jgi:hypothetical protein
MGYAYSTRIPEAERSDTSRSTLPTQEWGGNQVARDLWDRAPRGEPVDAYGADYGTRVESVPPRTEDSTFRLFRSPPHASGARGPPSSALSAAQDKVRQAFLPVADDTRRQECLLHLGANPDDDKRTIHRVPPACHARRARPPVVKKRSNHEGGLTLLHPSGYDFLDRSCAQIHPSFRLIKSGQRSNVLPQKWLAQHGMVAAQYAGSVLNGQSPEVPDSLSDLKVESRMGLVSFGMLVGPFYSFGS